MPVLNVIFSSLRSYPFSASALPTNLEHSAFLSLGRALIRRGRAVAQDSLGILDRESRRRRAPLRPWLICQERGS
jgi:hypothetical protein